MKIPPLRTKSLLESNPLKPELLVGGLAVLRGVSGRGIRELDASSLPSRKLVGHHRKVTLAVAWLESVYYPTLSTESSLNNTLVRHYAINKHLRNISYSSGALPTVT